LPTEAKRLAGNPGKRPLNMEEPIPPTSDATFEEPAELTGDPVAIAYWHELAPMLRRIRQITDADRGVLVALCVQWSRYVEATKMLAVRDAEGRSRMLIRLENGTYMQNPYIAIANKSLILCTKLWVELGLTPSARSRVTSQPDPHDDPFAEFDEPSPIKGSRARTTDAH
jgi:P27 family predicted phage terminase small subunit